MLTSSCRKALPSRWLAWLVMLAGFGLATATQAGWNWGPAVSSLSRNPVDAQNPKVAGNPKGTAMAVWSYFNGVNWIIESARFNNNVWGPAVAINQADGIPSLPTNLPRPQVAIDGNGIARAVWMRFNGGTNVIESAVHRNGAWTPPVTLSTLRLFAQSPQIAMNAAGATAVTWLLNDGVNWLVQARLLINGEWQDSVTLSDPSQSAASPQAAINANGVVTFVWTRFDGLNNVVQMVRYRNGNWGPVTDLSRLAQDAQQPQLAADDAGSVTVVWMQTSGNFASIQSRRLENGNWGAITALSIVSRDADTPHVAAGENGTATAIWTEQAVGQWTVHSRHYRDGAWGQPTVFASGGQDAWSPQIASSNGSNATAVWTRSNGNHTLIRGTFFNGGDSEWTPVAALSTAGQNAGQPQVAMLGDSQATAVWTRFNNGQTRTVQARQGRYVVIRYRLSLNKSGPGTVVSAPAGIDCGKTCNANFNEGARVTLTATPDEGVNFIGWSGACSGAGPCNLRLTGDMTVSARFVAAASYALRVARQSNGVVTSAPEGIDCGARNKDCRKAFGQDAVVTLTATPQAGYYFRRWSGCPAASENVCTVTVTQPVTTVTPVFAALPRYALTVSKTKQGRITSAPAGLQCGNNARSCRARFVTGTQVVLTALPAPGKQFGGWGGDCAGVEPVCEVTMDAKKKVSASFQ